MNTTKPKILIAVRIGNAVALGSGAGLVFGGGLENFGMMFLAILLGCFVERPLYPLILVGMIAFGSAYGPLRDMGQTTSSASIQSLTFALFAVTVGGAAWIGSSKITLRLAAITESILSKLIIVFLPILYFIIYLALTILMVNMLRG